MDIKRNLQELLSGSSEPDVKDQRKIFYVPESDPLFNVIVLARKITEKIPSKKQKHFKKIVADVLYQALSELEKELDQVLNPAQQQQQQQQPQQPQQIAKKR